MIEIMGYFCRGPSGTGGVGGIIGLRDRLRDRFDPFGMKGGFGGRRRDPMIEIMGYFCRGPSGTVCGIMGYCCRGPSGTLCKKASVL